MIKVYVSRFDREVDSEPHIECYEIEKTPGMKVLDALKAINEKYDADISYRESCRAGQCGSCAIKFNGNGALACQKEIKDGALIEPLDFPVIKDLIVDKSEIEQKIKDIHLNLIPQHEDKCFNESITSEDIKETKKVRGCIECHSCLSTCPVVKYFKDEYGGPYIMRYLSKFDKDPRDMDDRLRESLEEGLFKCTSCGKCKSVCPKNINTFGDAITKFREKACQEGEGPLPAHVKFKENIQKTNRSVVSDKSFVEEINKIKANKKGEKPKVALFTGCMMDKKLPEVGYALMDVLEANGIEVDIPQEQVCCGSPLINTGQTEAVQDLVDKNKEVFADYDTVITVCAGCGATLKNKHPEYGSELNVMDISEFLVDKLDYDKMNELDMKVTWHDPCHLVRGQNIKDQPREIIENMKGVEFVEMKHPCQCCGAGGGIKSGEPEIALKLSSEKAKMIDDTGAEAVITICPFCQLNLQDGLDNEEVDVKSMNLVELLQKAYE
ncbi:MAG: fumarate reductase (CoM/CoB) subunit TfrB [Methanobrevibacter sp.]|uniref:fumarate reductase (CoM/CoB) subunit TfrB n=1 Tax=Methanobrevibacter sp. TaxID=66852 RepID=UPI0026DF8899|nr:fumarate reductase (CoM/CoB) subunit TfrB [Methanobrevibacter sp.]MDO5848872.1 fumarate reductase (CoM/CoB) subunit TfrB [Methanobrevibacter sp.]